jgi:hypothetical protein
MKEQRVLVTGDEYAREVQENVDAIMAKGWQVVSVTTQHIASTNTVRGGYFIVFEREKQ